MLVQVLIGFIVEGVLAVQEVLGEWSGGLTTRSLCVFVLRTSYAAITVECMLSLDCERAGYTRRHDCQYQSQRQSGCQTA